jgi:hypothetical protein
MKRPLLLTIGMLFLASAALADHIGIYADDTGTSCNLTTSPPLNQASAVIHKFSAGAHGSRFKIDMSAATGIASFIGFVVPNPFTPIGDARTDMTVQYGSCMSGSFLVGHLQLLWGATPAGTISVVKPDGFTSVLHFDCADVEHPATGGYATIGGVGSTCGEPTAAEASPWGSV